MDRRQFLSNTALAATSLGIAAAGSLTAQTKPPAKKQTFKLKYAPHIGMFENSAGKEPLDQIRSREIRAGAIIVGGPLPLGLIVTM